MKHPKTFITTLVLAVLTITIGCSKKEKYAGEWRDNCINHLRQIDAAKNQWALEQAKRTGDTPTVTDITPYIKLDKDGQIPKCPADGKYTLNSMGQSPTCSIPSHNLP